MCLNGDTLLILAFIWEAEETDSEIERGSQHTISDIQLYTTEDKSEEQEHENIL